MKPPYFAIIAQVLRHTWLRHVSNQESVYRLTAKTTEADVLAAAKGILKAKLERQGDIGDPREASDFLRMRLGAFLHEEFRILWLNNRHRIMGIEKFFTGTIDGASVYPREVVKAALSINACATILAHNHPSGVAESSAADRAITRELIDALKLGECGCWTTSSYRLATHQHGGQGAHVSRGLTAKCSMAQPLWHCAGSLTF